MLTLLAVKKWCKKVWAWVKHNWYAPFIIIYTIVLWIMFRRKDAALDVLETRNSSYKAQIEAINDSHKEEIKKRNEVIEKYTSVINDLQEKYDNDKKELTAEKRKEIKRIVEKYYNKEDELAKLLADKFNLEYTD
jgi:hypothetical protein